MVVDEIDDVRNTANSKASKLEVDALSNKIDNINPTTAIRTIYNSTAEDFTEEQREYNKESYKIIMDGGYPDFLAGGLSVNYFIDGDKVAFSVGGTQCDDEFKTSFYSPFFLLADGSIEWGELILAPEVCYLYDPDHAMIFFRFSGWGLKGIVVMGLTDVCYVDLVNYANREVEFMHRDKRYRVSFDEEYKIGTPIEIPIGGGGNITVDSAMSSTSTNPVQNKVVTAALNTKADKTDIKTLNGVSLIGGGNLQLGDGQTIVYDDTAVYERIAEVEELAAQAKVSSELAIEGLNIHLEEVNEELFNTVTNLMKTVDDLAARVRALENK
jgi:hypothetical protein